MQPKDLNILIIEDSLDDVEVYIRYLTKIFMHPFIDHCIEADNAVRAIKKTTYDLILLDYNLPGTNGLDFLRSLHSLRLGTAIIALTGQGSESVAVEFMRLGVCDYLQKNKISSESLSYAINRALEISYSKRIEYEKHLELTKFAQTITHDLKAPLGRIETYINLILQDHSTNYIKYIINIKEDTRYVREFLDKLLQFAEFGKANISKMQLDLNVVARKAIQNLEIDIINSSANITISELPQIYGHQTSLIQLFQNIISNSIKYNILKPNITIESTKNGDNNIITIQDNGIGIPKKDFSSVFEPFVRIKNNLNQEGMGLGLSLCKAIIEGHNGEIELVNVQNGTKVIISFPKII